MGGQELGNRIEWARGGGPGGESRVEEVTRSLRGKDEACIPGSCVNVGCHVRVPGVPAKACLGTKVEEMCLLIGMCWQLGQCPGVHDAMWLQV